MKKLYEAPNLTVVNIQVENLLGTASNVDGNVFNGSIKAGSGPARSRDYDDWDD